MSLSRARDTSVPWSRVQGWVFAGMATAALAMAAAARLRLDPAAPLWIDETWTGAFASQTSLASLTDQIRNDANAPAYSYLIWLWSRAFGLSDVALHLPSLFFGLLTPAVGWLGLRTSRPALALAWAVLLAAWIPGLDQANVARCYALLFCAAALSTIAHLRLLEAPSLGRATVWASCAAFTTLVHYHAGLLAFAQGMAFVAVHRGRAVKLWPAAWAFLPAFAWLAWHAPRLADFADPRVAWYSRLSVADLPLAVIVAIGGPLTLASLVCALLVGILLKPEQSHGGPGGRDRTDAAIWWAGGVAVAAAALSVAIGVVRPTFTFRYLTPFVPGALLLAAVWATRAGRAPFLSSCVLLAGPLLAVALALASGENATNRVYSLEAASAWLAEARPTRLAFFWDHPATPIEARSQLDAVGGFFLRRAGVRVDVTPVYPVSDDMNGPVLEAAGADPDAAVLWAYDTLIHDTTARNRPPRLAALDPGLECRDFGAFNIGVVACRRRPAR